MQNEIEGDALTPCTTRPLRVLIADDYAGTRCSLQLVLRRLDCGVDAVEDGLEAVEALRSREYDLVLMDVVMPRMDGLEATRQIRLDRPVGSRPRIVGTSADTSPENRAICSAVGMNDFLPKPLDLNALVRILDEVTRQLDPVC